MLLDHYNDSNFTESESVEDSVITYQLCMDDTVCELRIAPYQIDQKRDFVILVYKDTIVFLVNDGDIYSSNRISDELSIQLAKNGMVVGYVIFSEDHAARIKETYGNKK